MHVSEELLELYILQRLSAEQLAPIEEHLLVCSCCREFLSEIHEYVRALKVAIREITEAGEKTDGRCRPLLVVQRNGLVKIK